MTIVLGLMIGAAVLSLALMAFSAWIASRMW